MEVGARISAIGECAPSVRQSSAQAYPPHLPGGDNRHRERCDQPRIPCFGGLRADANHAALAGPRTGQRSLPSGLTVHAQTGRTIGDENSALPSDLALGSVLVFIESCVASGGDGHDRLAPYKRERPRPRRPLRAAEGNGHGFSRQICDRGATGKPVAPFFADGALPEP